MSANWLIAVAGAISLMAPLPPSHLRFDNAAPVIFADPVTVDLRCGGDADNTNGRILACVYRRNSLMIVPNPCAHTEESYARLMCHELGHVNGWPGNHPDPQIN